MTSTGEAVLQSCRTCLLLSNKIYPIFETTLESGATVSMMLSSLLIEISENDCLPKIICHSCLMKLCTAHSFVETCKRSQDILKQNCYKRNEEEHILNDNTELRVLEHGTLNKNDGFENTREENDDTLEENIYITCDEDDNVSHDSDDEDYLIEKSVRLTALWKLGRNENDATDSDSDDELREQEARTEHTERLEDTSCTSDLYSLSCPICCQIFTDLLLFSAHLAEHNSLIECKNCSTCFDDADVYIKHSCSKQTYDCKFCKKSFSTQEDCKLHLQMHNIKKFACPAENCEKVFCRKQSLTSHYLTMHSEKRNFLCSQCGAAFKNYDNYRYHIKKHEGPSHVCKYCGRGFMQSIHLKDHMWRHTGDKPHKCTKCVKSFRNPRELKRHVASNCGSRRVRKNKLVL